MPKLNLRQDPALVGAVGAPRQPVVWIRNSGRTTFTCAQRWLFKEGEGLVPERTPRPFTYGGAWHEIMEEGHRWWMMTDGLPWDAMHDDCPFCSGAGCKMCDGSGASAFARVRSAWLGTEAEGDIATLTWNLDGWLRVYGDRPDARHKVLAVEMPFMMPIVSPTSGRTYRTNVYVTVDTNTGEWRRSRRSEVHRPPPGCEVHRVNMQVWLRGIIDVVTGGERDDGTYGVCIDEHKTSANPEAWLSSMSLDPQCAVYTLGLQRLIDLGMMEEDDPSGRYLAIPKGSHVGGFRYRVTSSRLLRAVHWNKKDDGARFSRAKGKLSSVPPWRMEEAIRDEMAKTGAPVDDAAELLRGAQTVVKDRFKQTYGAFSSRDLERTSHELFGLARAEAGRWAAAATLDPSDPTEAAVMFPRSVVCRRQFGTCPYISPCSLDDGQYSRAGLVVRDDLEIGEDPEPEEEVAEPGHWGW